jgi:SAM-dependent methyltransferase
MTSTPPSPLRIFETLGAFRQTAALKAGIELDIFTAIAEGAKTPSTLAARCDASERGVRILADYLAMLGFLRKQDASYSLAPDAAAFLDRRSDTCIGAASAETFCAEAPAGAFETLKQAVRLGGTPMPAQGTLTPEHPIWVAFARSMSPSGAFLARLLARVICDGVEPPTKVLDIAAGHGLFGIELAKRTPGGRVFAVDWPQVLAVARENAVAAGVADRFEPLPGDALTVDLGSGYDLALVTNFCPDLDTTGRMLRRIHASLADGGRVAVLELMLNDDRISPPAAVSLNLSLLATTPRGETRTPSQLAAALERAGFTRIELFELQPAPHRVMTAWSEKTRDVCDGW